ncbi:MAG: CPBP family intramembrane metalloprotease [Lachnospiraceae bacterium]|nr:CPBP family intramembrane metalloprotease [Lachnospiraceae bacterium]
MPILRDKRKLLLTIPLGVASSLGLSALVHLVLTAVGSPLQEVYRNNFSSMLSLYSFPYGLLVYAVLMPCIEELLFRYILFDRLSSMIPRPTAAIASSFVFGIYHQNTVQLIYAFIMGLLLCFVYHRFGSILASLFMHSGANACACILGSFPAFDFLNSTLWQIVLMLLGLGSSGLIVFLLLPKESYKRISRPKDTE